MPVVLPNFHAFAGCQGIYHIRTLRRAFIGTKQSFSRRLISILERCVHEIQSVWLTLQPTPINLRVPVPVDTQRGCGRTAMDPKFRTKKTFDAKSRAAPK